MAYCSNRSDGDNVVTDVGPGTYGLSNATLDYPWKKVDRGREKLRKVIEEGGCHSSKEELTDHLMQALADDTWYVCIGSRLLIIITTTTTTTTTATSIIISYLIVACILIPTSQTLASIMKHCCTHHLFLYNL